MDVQIESEHSIYITAEPHPGYRIHLHYLLHRLDSGGLGVSLAEWSLSTDLALRRSGVLTPLFSQAMFLPPPYAVGEQLQVSNVCCIYTLTDKDPGREVLHHACLSRWPVHRTGLVAVWRRVVHAPGRRHHSSEIAVINPAGCRTHHKHQDHADSIRPARQ